MTPSDTLTMILDWVSAESDKKHSRAVKYIEENVDLVDADLQKFMDDCPPSCLSEVYEMLLKAGIDMKGYVLNGSLKHVYDPNPQWYTIDYKQKLDEYIDRVITWKTDWQRNAIVLDTIPAVEEA